MCNSESWRNGFLFRASSIISRLLSFSLQPFIFNTLRLWLVLKNSEKALAPSVSRKFSERLRHSMFATANKIALVDMHKSDLYLNLIVSLVSKILTFFILESILSANQLQLDKPQVLVWNFTDVTSSKLISRQLFFIAFTASS